MVRNRSWARRPLVWLSAVALSVPLWHALAYPRGALEARIDDARGDYEVLGYGLPAPWTPGAARLLEERYGVRLRGVAGCCVSPWVRWHADGYNAASEPLLRERFGKDVIEECFEEGRRRWKAERPDQAKP
jgi:hypothetical protein